MLALALLGLLAVPIYVSFDIRRGGPAPRADVALLWLFGLVKIPIPQPRAKPKPRRPRSNPFPRAVRSPAFRRNTGKLLARLWRALRLPHLEVHTVIGFNDPADTGLLYGLFSALPRLPINFTPVFHRPAFEINARGTAGVIPLQILAITLAWLLSPATWIAFKGARP